MAQGNEGQAFIQALAQATGADVAASTDLTGDAAQGGDWVLEASTGTIDTGLALSQEAQQSYSQVLNYSDDYELAQLANEVYKNNPDNIAGWTVLGTHQEGEFFAA